MVNSDSDDTDTLDFEFPRPGDRERFTIQLINGVMILVIMRNRHDVTG